MRALVAGAVRAGAALGVGATVFAGAGWVAFTAADRVVVCEALAGRAFSVAGVEVAAAAAVGASGSPVALVLLVLLVPVGRTSIACRVALLAVVCGRRAAPEPRAAVDFFAIRSLPYPVPALPEKGSRRFRRRL
jgi:hypothetical protein